MNRLGRCSDPCFPFHELLPLFTGSRQKPHISSAVVLASVCTLFACNRTSLPSLEKDRVGLPQRLRGLGGPRPPSGLPESGRRPVWNRPLKEGSRRRGDGPYLAAKTLNNPVHQPLTHPLSTFLLRPAASEHI
jgi:hypothetical protein